jgi:hypothetical protein
MKCKNTKSATWGKKVLVALTLILSANLAFAGPRKMSKDLESKTSGKVDVIVQFNHVPNANDHQRVANHGGKIKRELGRFKGGAYTMPASALEDLANDPDVVYITPDRPLSGASTSSSAWTLDYHSETINTSAATAVGLDGTGIGVAIIDSGVANVPDLTRSNVVYQSGLHRRQGERGRRPVWPRHPRSRHHCGKRKCFHRTERLLHVQRHCPKREHRQPSGARCERQRHGTSNVIAAIQTGHRS